MSIRDSYLYFSPLAAQWTLGQGLVVARWESPPIRRAYLSGTLVATDAFVRAFGRKPDVVISPTTTAGECERLMLIPSIAFPESDGAPQAKEVVNRHKLLIMVPSYRRRQVWRDLEIEDLGGN